MKIILPDGLDAYNLHYNKICEVVDMTIPETSFADVDTRFGFICFTNRCGSNFLAESVASSGTLNLARESFNFEEVSRIVSQHKLTSFNELFWRVARADAVNGRFLVKISIGHLVLLVSTGILPEIFDRSSFIMVERSDKLGQAISLSIADQTKKWASFVEAPADGVEPKYSFVAIEALLKSLTIQNALFDEFFAFNGITPLCVNYETFVEAPAFFANQVAKHMSISDFVFDRKNVRTERQTRQINLDWRHRFLKDLQEKG